MSTPLVAVRRLIVYVLLFALVVIFAIGLSGLLSRALDTSAVLAGTATTTLATSLAFTVIGGPLAGLLWWAVWRWLGAEAERRSIAWALYVCGLYIVSLAVATVQLLILLAGIVDGRTENWNGHLATGLVWSAVWVWHRWMWRHPDGSPLELRDVPIAVGSAYGLALGASMAAVALTRLFRPAVQAALGAPTEPLGAVAAPSSWWQPVLAAAVWAAGGAGVWAWHWYGERGRTLRTAFSDVGLVLVGIFAAIVAALGGAGTVLFVLLRLLADRASGAPLESLLSPLPAALAAGSVGWLVWAYHRPRVDVRSPAAQQAAHLVTSAVALIGAASGVGVIVNAALSLAAPTLAGANARTLLLAGLSSLAVGGTVWWLVWKPLKVTVREEDARFMGRRVYLVVIFGVSAIAALVTLLMIGNQLFQFLLVGGTGDELLSRIRAPFGVLVATALAAGYHFALWRHDRAVLGGAGAVRHAISQAILVTGYDPAPFARAIADATGASVTVWGRANGSVRAQDDQELPEGSAPGPVLGPGPVLRSVDAAAPSGEDVARALQGIVAKRVLVLVGPGGRVEAVPLRD